MKDIKIANGNLSLSEIGLGCMRMASLEKTQAENIIKCRKKFEKIKDRLCRYITAS